MASSSHLLGKRKPGDDLETKPVLKKHKDKETKSDVANLISLKGAVKTKNVVLVSKLSSETEISDIINFFKDVGEVVHVRLMLGPGGKRSRSGLVDFASANEAKKGMQMKNGEYLRGSKIHVEMASERAPYRQPKYCIDHKVWYEEYSLQPIKDDETPCNIVEALEEKDGEYLHDHPNLLMKGLDKTPNSVEKVLLVANLSPHTTKIEHIIKFFRDVGKVVGVRLIVNHECKHVGYCFVEFASANQAKKALKKKNGAYLYDHLILLMKLPILLSINFFKDVGEVVHVRLTVDHKGKHGKHVGHGFVEFASANEAMKALAKKNGEYWNNRKIDLIVFKTAPNPKLPNIKFLNHVGEIVRARLIVDQFGEDVGCGFLEFASANIAMDVMLKKTGIKFYLNLAEKARYPFRPKIAEKLWYEDNLLRESLDSKIKRTLKKQNLKKQAFDLKQHNLKKHKNRIEYSGLGSTRVAFRGKKIICSDEE